MIGETYFVCARDAYPSFIRSHLSCFQTDLKQRRSERCFLSARDESNNDGNDHGVNEGAAHII